MSATISELRPASDAEWDEALAHCPHATFFHSRSWAEAFCAADADAQPAPMLARFEDGACVLLPFTHRRGAMLSSPAGTYGGWLAGKTLDPERAGLLVQTLANRFPHFVWRINPFDAAQIGAVPADARDDVTHALRLDADLDTLVRRWRKGHRAAARQAERSGVSVRLAKGEDDWREYFQVYQASLERWGERATSRYGWELFASLMRCSERGVQLWLAEWDEQLVAGALCLSTDFHTSYWHGAAHGEAFGLRPVHLLVRCALGEAIDSGRAWFDFNPSGGHEGVAAFKRHFGAEERSCPVSSRAPRPGFARRLLARLR